MSDILSRLQSALGAPYRVERELGGGGMSRVFVAEEVSLGRKVVVKVLPPEMGAGVNAERFRREIQLAASLQHPHIVPLLSAGHSDDLVWYTMPLIEGESLRTRLAREGELPIPEAVRLLRDVADALAYAHQHGVVHRDIKPDNVLITGQHAVVTDFGVAKAVAAATGEASLTSVGVALGTPAYMAPEQAAALPHVDHRADVYALGAMAYEMLTGAPPFSGDATVVLAAHVTRAPEAVTTRRTAVPAALGALVMRCLEKKPADRWQSAGELHQQLEVMATPSGGTAPTGAVAATGARRRLSRPVLGALAAAVVAVLAVVGWLVTRTPARVIERIAVLPLRPATNDSAQALLAEGLTREVISALTGAGVHVIGYSSVERYAGRSVPVDQIARELGVDAVALGVLRRAAPTIQVALELADPATRENLWARNFDVPGAGLSGLASSVARELVGAMRADMSADQRGRLREARPVNPAAYNEYLLGRHLALRWTPEAYRQAIAHLTRAIELDSTFAAAHASLASTYATMTAYYRLADPGEGFPRAQAAAERALALDPRSGEAHLALGLLKQFDWDPTGAEREFRRAIELEPSPFAHLVFGWLLLFLRRAEEAQAQMEQAVALDPTAPYTHNDLSILLRTERQFDRAIAEAEVAVALDSSFAEAHGVLAQGLAHAGRFDEALAQIDRMEALGRPGQDDRRAVVLAMAGRTAEARRLLSRPGRRAPGSHAARAYIALGDNDTAIALLQRLWESDRRGFHYWSPEYDGVRADPRFQALVREMTGRLR